MEGSWKLKPNNFLKKFFNGPLGINQPLMGHPNLGRNPQRKLNGLVTLGFKVDQLGWEQWLLIKCPGPNCPWLKINKWAS